MHILLENMWLNLDKTCSIQVLVLISSLCWTNLFYTVLAISNFWVWFGLRDSGFYCGSFWL